MVGDDASLKFLGMNDCIREIGVALHHYPPVLHTEIDPRPPVFLSVYRVVVRHKGGLKIDEMESNLVEAECPFGRPVDDLDRLFALPSGPRAVRAPPRVVLGEAWEVDRWRGR